MQPSAQDDSENLKSALRAYWLKSLEYNGPLSAEQEKRYQWYRWFCWKDLSDEAVRQWGISKSEADATAEAAVSTLEGVLRYLARLIALENLVEGKAP